VELLKVDNAAGHGFRIATGIFDRLIELLGDADACQQVG
jgi:hypothetical protein